ncbi:MAG TPA: hypothetical protein VFI24_10875 [Pyrinomonadaceae bacterium]|nr:hypothetical protein [Pyrinomonadaceae bacterium]
MNKRLPVVLMLVLLAVVVAETATGQKQSQSWKEWSKKDAEKILNDSPWGHLQVDTDLSEMFFQPTTDGRTSGGRAPNANSRLEQGATNQATSMTYGIRFFSARPVRRAFIRMIQLQQRNLEPDVVARMNNFAEFTSEDAIIIAVTIEGTDKRSLGKAMQIIESAATGTLKNSTYLERNDGKRLFLDQYAPPGKDGFGARFIFPRMVDEKPFLTTDFNDVRFVAEFGTSIKLNMRFKVSDMMLDGKLEY